MVTTSGVSGFRTGGLVVCENIYSFSTHMGQEVEPRTMVYILNHGLTVTKFM